MTAVTLLSTLYICSLFISVRLVNSISTSVDHDNKNCPENEAYCDWYLFVNDIKIMEFKMSSNAVLNFLPSSSHFGLKISFVKEGRKWWCHYFSKENYRSVFVNSLNLMSDYDILIFDEIVLEFAVSIFHIDTLWQTKMLVLPTSRTKVYVYKKASTQKIMESLLNRGFLHLSLSQ